MIDQGLFFATPRIWWEGTLSPYFVVGVLFVGIAIYWWLRCRPERVSMVTKNEPYTQTLPSPSDLLYAPLTLAEIRRWLSVRYHPFHSWAHGVDDIRRYCTNANILSTIQRLEYASYTSTRLDPLEIDTIHGFLTSTLV